jgi:hypothetical protein
MLYYEVSNLWGGLNVMYYYLFININIKKQRICATLAPTGQYSPAVRFPAVNHISSSPDWLSECVWRYLEACP